MATKVNPGAMFGLLAVVLAVLTIFISMPVVTTIIAVLGILAGILAWLKGELILGIVPIIVCIVWGFFL